MSDSYTDLHFQLVALSEELESVAGDAAALVASVPLRDEAYTRYDPRHSQLKAAQFASSISLAASSLRRQAKLIRLPEENEPDAAATAPAPDHGGTP